MVTLGVLWLVGCSDEHMLKSGDLDAEAPSAPSTDLAAEVRVDVYPSAVRDGDDAIRALPASTLHEVEPGRDLELGVLSLPAPQRQPGEVVAYQLNPSVANLPGDAGVPVAGTVYLEVPGTLQRYAARTDADGGFEAWVVPEQDYRLQVVPDDPMVPMYAGDLAIGARPEFEALDLGAGVPIYGVVESRGGAVAGARIYVESPDGRRSASATADSHGIYQLRVTPGAWTVVSEGRGLNQDPVIRTRPVAVGAAGAQVDFEYPTTLSQVLVDGRLEDESGSPVSDATVRLRATELDGYARLEGVSWSIEVPIADNGTFLARVVPGAYALEVLPGDGADLAPLAMEVELSGPDNALGNIVLHDRVPVDLGVVDEIGELLVDARISCVETGFDGHTYTGFTDGEGVARMRLPAVEVACELTPPGDRVGLAPRRATFVPERGDDRTFDLVPGQSVSGKVEIDGVPEAFAVVEVRGAGGALLGFDVTDDKGAFEIRVDLR